MVTEKKKTNTETIFHYLDFNPDGQPAVLLLHGLGADGSSWGYQIPVLCEAGLRPIAPDLPGFGKSIPGEGRWSIARAANEVARMVTGLNTGAADPGWDLDGRHRRPAVCPGFSATRSKIGSGQHVCLSASQKI